MGSYVNDVVYKWPAIYERLYLFRQTKKNLGISTTASSSLQCLHCIFSAKKEKPGLMEEGGEENGMSVYAIIWQTNKKFNPFLFRLLLEKAQ